ncbi:MAG: hypothetical protein OER82_04260 [Nitrosopumilus sp.]|nr:hypothetical protein [Nitrosopumilus sp.]
MEHKKAIKSLPVQHNEVRLIALDVLNTMGRSGSNGTKSISSRDEIQKLEINTNDNEMKLLSKSHSKTWNNSNSSKTNNLDHCHSK